MALVINIDRTTFPQTGGSYEINLTKDDINAWDSVTIPNALWYSVNSKTEVSPFLYTIVVDVDTNNTGTSRSMSIAVTVDGQSELFTIVQPGGSVLTANIVASTSGNTAAAGGQVTVDVQAVNGTDSLSTASSDQSYCTLTSTTHGVTSGGVTCTRFVFTFSANTGNTTRSANLTFTVSDGNGNTDSATLAKTQNYDIVQTGSLSVANASAAASATSANALISLVDMQTATLAVDTLVFNFVTSATIQVIGGQYNLVMAFPANTGSARTESIQISGTDNWGNALTATMTLTQAAAGATHSINAAWRTGFGYDGVLNYEGGTEQALVTYTGTFTGDATISYGTLPDGVTITMPNNSVVYGQYTGGSISDTIQIPITIERTGDDNVVYSAQLILTLQASGVFPIWKDVFGHIASDEDWEDYELQEGGALLYAGRAFKYPDESDIQVNVSRVVAPYLTSYFMDVDFVNDGVVLGSYTFVRDYSYDRTMHYTQNLWLNAPVNGRIPAGAKLSASLWGATSGGSMQVTDEGGSLVVNEAIVKGLNVGEWISGMPGKSYSFGGWKYEVVDACRGALLKYVNAYGAFDYLLVEGVAKKTDKITRASYEKDAAAMTKDFESKDYQATMEATWKGTTGWLTDSQSLRMKHLVESVEVYMVDMQTGEEIPVTMRDSSLEYKTFDNNSRKMVNYSLSWTESQKKIRR